MAMKGTSASTSAVLLTSLCVCVFLCKCATVFEYVFYPPVTSYRDYCLAEHASDLYGDIQWKKVKKRGV